MNTFERRRLYAPFENFEQFRSPEFLFVRTVAIQLCNCLDIANSLL